MFRHWQTQLDVKRNLVVSHQLEEPNRISGVGLTECDSHGLDDWSPRARRRVGGREAEIPLSGTDPCKELCPRCNSPRLMACGIQSCAPRWSSAWRQQTSGPGSRPELLAEMGGSVSDCGHHPRKESMLATCCGDTEGGKSRLSCSGPAGNCNLTSDEFPNGVGKVKTGGESRN